MTFAAGAFLFGHFFTWFNAVKMTNIASAVVLAASASSGGFGNYRICAETQSRRRPIMGIVLALLGGVLIAGLDYRRLTDGNFAGDILAFSGRGLLWAFTLLSAMKSEKNVPGSTYVFLVFLSCWICFSVGMIVSGTPALDIPHRTTFIL